MDELIIESINGNENAFTELILIYQNDLYRIASIRLNNQDDVNDAVQETMITAYNSLKSLKEPKFFKTWLIKILINQCNEIHRKNTKVLNIFNKLNQYNNSDSYTDSAFSKIHNQSELEDCFKLLSYNEQLCITMFYANHYTINEIAKILNSSPNTIKSRISRAKNKIKKEYKGGAYYE